MTTNDDGWRKVIGSALAIAQAFFAIIFLIMPFSSGSGSANGPHDIEKAAALVAIVGMVCAITAVFLAKGACDE